MYCRSADIWCWVSGDHSNIEKQKNKKRTNVKDIRQPGQLIVSDQMPIASPSSPYFGNTFVGCCNSPYQSFFVFRNCLNDNTNYLVRNVVFLLKFVLVN